MKGHFLIATHKSADEKWRRRRGKKMGMAGKQREEESAKPDVPQSKNALCPELSPVAS